MHYSAVLSVLLVLVGGCIAQKNLNCQFSDELDVGYRCLVVDATVSDDDFVIFVGQHLEGRSDSDVKGVFFTKSSLSRVPMEIFENFPNVESINVSGCKLPTMNRFYNCKSLKNLDTSFNKLLVIRPNTFAACTNLTKLILSNNQINEFDGTGLGGLVELDLGGNQITDLGQIFVPNPALERVHLEDNRIEDLIYGVFENNKELVEIDLKSNRIRIIEEGVFDHLKNLGKLYLAKNRCINMNFNLTGGSVNDIIPHLENCLPRDVDLLNCKFSYNVDLGYTCDISSRTVKEGRKVEFVGTHLDGKTDEDVTRIKFLNSFLERVPMEIFDTFVNMNWIDVGGRNNLNNMNEFTNCKSLNVLDAFWNQLSLIRPNTFALCSNLTKLILSNNLITEFNGTGLESLVELRLDYNEITSFSMDTFGTLENLEILILTMNEIHFIDPKLMFALSNLRTLFLAHNRISKIFAGIFSPLIHLQSLSLYRNGIYYIHQDAFLGLTELNKLDLGDNSIEDLGQIFFHMPGLERVHLDDNRIYTLTNRVFENNTELIQIDLNGNIIRIIEVGVFDHLQNLEGLNLLNNLCITENFRINPPGNLIGVLPFLQQCLPSAEVEIYGNILD